MCGCVCAHVDVCACVWMCVLCLLSLITFFPSKQGDFDDEAMMAVDEALAEAFKLHMSHRSQKKVKKGTGEESGGRVHGLMQLYLLPRPHLEEELSVVHFKLRWVTVCCGDNFVLIM